MNWPAGQIDRLSAALNTYNAMQAYDAAKDKVTFLNSNPGVARTFSRVTRWRMGKD